MFFANETEWTARCEAGVAEIFDRFATHGLTEDRFGLVAIQESEGAEAPVGYAYNGDWLCYPCSLVKAFHLVHVLDALEKGAIEPHAELERAMHDMITWSSNNATNYIIDVVNDW